MPFFCLAKFLKVLVYLAKSLKVLQMSRLLSHHYQRSLDFNNVNTNRATLHCVLFDILRSKNIANKQTNKQTNKNNKSMDGTILI